MFFLRKHFLLLIKKNVDDLLVARIFRKTRHQKVSTTHKRALIVRLDCFDPQSTKIVFG